MTNPKISMHAKINSNIKKILFRILGIRIGKRTYILKKVHIDFTRGKVIIGNDVLISNKCTILSHVGFVEVKGPTIIEDNVIISAHSIIFPGIKIGRGTIIYPGSVVTKSVPPNSILIGNPAKIIKEII